VVCQYLCLEAESLYLAVEYQYLYLAVRQYPSLVVHLYLAPGVAYHYLEEHQFLPPGVFQFLVAEHQCQCLVVYPFQPV